MNYRRVTSPTESANSTRKYNYELGIIYLLTKDDEPDLIRIGTINNTNLKTLNQRLSYLNKTSRHKRLWVEYVKDPKAVREAINSAFLPERDNKRGDFFHLKPSRIIPILTLLGTTPPLSFKKLGIPVGSILEAKVNKEAAMVTDDRRVIFRGEKLTLSEATERLLNISYDVRPMSHWQYEGRFLSSIYNDTYLVT